MPTKLPGTHQFINPRSIPKDRDVCIISTMGAAVRIAGIAFAIATVLFGINLVISGSQAISPLVARAHNPFLGLALGIVLTAVIQSSSATTALTVTAVGGGLIPLEAAVPIIMGANIGTTFTPFLVAFSFFRNQDQYQRAIHTAGMHMWFNVSLVALLLPLELLAHPFQHFSHLDTITPPTNHSPLVFNPTFSLICGAFLILISVRIIAALLNTLMATTTHTLMERAPGRSFSLGVLVGTLITMMVQASTVTICSLLAFTVTRPIRQRDALALIVGANVGTTLLSLIVAFYLNTAAVQAALIHLFFNLIGAIALLCFPALRTLLLYAGTLNSRIAQLGYALSFFFLLSSYIIAPAIFILAAS
ncbi:hypothetical protein GP475_10960 [Corynebacterium poyangense]|uniref:Uncharacterized protein n=1 Tax=Corynebacterium poyangense TaxID=2684405 RepID=A0A7H0SRB4_9CORY|nr:Na/Pi symporter [Corynebacterium poyangense]MBZ8176523.1 hypothetical protein [Corynebacterium poyangense]QNQ91089.1 hypothetical protein GP475_10960 [Corynebacterium poyangense]